MSLRNLEFAVAESAASMRRNSAMSVASVTTVGLSLAILGGFALLILGLNNVANTLPRNLEIAVFLKKDTPRGDAVELKSKIAALPRVRYVKLVPAEVAWPEFKQRFGEQIELGGIEGNPLPDKLRVKVKKPEFTLRTAERIRSMPNVDEVIEGRSEVALVMRFSNLAKLVGAFSAGVLFIVTAFIISNTIRLTVYARRREIRIMQLVGATNWFIRLPLMLEGVVLGGVGAGIACLLVFVGQRYVTQVATHELPFLGQFSSDVEPTVFFGGLVLVGCFVGAMGSLVSIRRFLKA